MRLSLLFLARKLEKQYSVELRCDDPRQTFEEARLITAGSRGAAGIVFVASSDQGDEVRAANPQAVIWVGDDEPPALVPCAWVRGDVDAQAVSREVSDLFRRFRTWYDEVVDLLLDARPIREAAMKLGEVTTNPFYFCDVDFRIIAISDDRRLSSFSKTWRFQQEFGRHPLEVVAEMLVTGDFDAIAKNRPAWLFSNAKSYDLPFVVKSVYNRGSVYGYLFTIPFNDEAYECDIELLETLGNLISRFVAHRVPSQPTTGFPKETVLCDCLLGNPVDRKELIGALTLLGWVMDDRYLVTQFAIDGLSRESVERARVQAGMVESNINGKAIIHDGGLAIIQNLNRLDHHRKLDERVESLCAKFGWRAGVSNEFEGFEQLPLYFKQACLALASGEGQREGGRVLHYRDCALDTICDILVNASNPAFYLHCDVEMLMRYDEETDSCLVETLDAYLKSGRSIAHTAQELNLHRNSVIYRIKKIQSLMVTSIDDADNRLVLALSLKLLARSREAGEELRAVGILCK